MARLKAYSVEVPFVEGRPWEEYDRLEEAAVEAAKAEVRASADGPLVGEELTWPVGDGRARYLIARQSPLTLIHLAVGDAWQVEYALIRGTRLRDAQNQFAARKRFSALFAAGKKA